MPAPHVFASPVQRGFALIVLLALLTAGAMFFVIDRLDAAAIRRQQDAATEAALAQAKDALIGHAISQQIELAGYFRLPDIGSGNVGYTEGSAGSNFSGNNQDLSIAGKVPWKTLGIPPKKEECLWYVLSGRFKATPITEALNWDTQGQIDVIDGNGNSLATNLVALVVAPGPPIDAQDRSLGDPSYTQCRGNYDARNYLDSFKSANAVAGELNYFTGSEKNRVAQNANNKRFVMTANEHYNDRFLFITVDELYSKIIRRTDFATQISSLLDDGAFQAHLQSLSISPTDNKGTANLKCSQASRDNRTFCANWKEMLLLTELPSPDTINIDGVPSTNCTRVLIFGGKKIGGQARNTDTARTDPNNYLEGDNATAFAVPKANSADFAGSSTFSSADPSADLLRCLP